MRLKQDCDTFGRVAVLQDFDVEVEVVRVLVDCELNELDCCTVREDVAVDTDDLVENWYDIETEVDSGVPSTERDLLVEVLLEVLSEVDIEVLELEVLLLVDVDRDSD